MNTGLPSPTMAQIKSMQQQEKLSASQHGCAHTPPPGPHTGVADAGWLSMVVRLLVCLAGVLDRTRSEVAPIEMRQQPRLVIHRGHMQNTACIRACRQQHTQPRPVCQGEICVKGGAAIGGRHRCMGAGKQPVCMCCSHHQDGARGMPLGKACQKRLLQVVPSKADT